MPHLLQLLLLLALIVTLSKIAGALSQRIGQPAVFGELLIGLILGPTFLNILGFPLFRSHELEIVIGDLAELGVIFLMFLAGMETDLKAMRKVGVAASLGAVGGVLLPFAGGVGVSLPFGLPLVEAIFIGTVLTATSVSITAQTLIELNQLHSKEGSTILGAAIIDDVLGILALSLVVALSTGGATSAALASEDAAGGASPFLTVLTILLRMAVFFGAAVLLGQRVIPRVTEWIDRHVKVSEAIAAFVVAVIFLYAWGAEALGGVAAITGSYIAGLLFAQTRFGHAIEEKLRVPTYSLLVPVFLIHIGLQANAREISGNDIWLAAVIVVVAILGKIIGSGGGVMLRGFTVMEALRVGIGMVSRGEVALIVTSVGLRAGVIQEDIFSLMVIMTLVTTLITPILLRMVFPVEAPAGADPKRG